ncbi:MAG: T9SS type A sorting domain-containing protein [Flavobacteriales bacterium]|nr:T9SS type A sorting domain-containing protein [Flavobacteriales bacterium]
MKISRTHLQRSLPNVAIVLFYCALSPEADAQPSYVRTYSVPPNTVMHGCDVTDDDGLIMCGTVDDSLGLLIRLDVAGNTLWTRTYSAIGTNDGGTFGSSWIIEFLDVAAIGDSGYVVVGSGDVQGNQGRENLIVRLDSSGDHIWGGSRGTIYYDVFAHIDRIDSVTVLVSGRTGGLSTSRATLERFNLTTGFQEGGLAGHWGYSQPLAIDLADDGGFVLAGTLDFGFSSFVIKADASFDTLWTIDWDNFSARTVVGLTDGSVIAAGDTVVMRILPNGQVDWSKQLHVGDGAITDVEVRMDGTILLTGWSDPVDSYSWLVLMDQAGNVVGSQRYGDTGDMYRVSQLELLPGDHARLIGTAGLAGALVIATDSAGTVETCSYPTLVFGLNNFTSSQTAVLSVTTPVPESFYQVTTADFPAYASSTIVCADDEPWSATGTVFADTDQDGSLDAGEPGFPFGALSVAPNNGYVFTNYQGAFEFHTPVMDTYSVSHANPGPWWQVTTPSMYTVPFTINDSTFTDLDFGYTPTVDTTLLVGWIASPALTCFGIPHMHIGMQNQGTTTPQGVAALTLDTLVSFSWSNPPPDSIVGGTVYWSFDSVGWYQYWQQEMTIHMPGSVYWGDTVTSTLVIWTDDGNGTLSPVDTVLWTEVITCAYDPNDKVVTPEGSGAYGAIPFDTEWLTYTIRFQNTGNDTATTVVIEDLLSADLEHGSLQVLGYSHPITGLNISSGGLASFRFDNIQLPDSNVNEQASHGFVKFRVRVIPGLPHLTGITNNSGIYFDLNPPVITNTVLNTIVDCAQAQLDPQIYDQGSGLLFPYTFFMDTMVYAYQWFLDGAPISGADTMAHQALITGYYTVQLTDPYGCSFLSDPVQVLITAIAARDEGHMMIAPNPFHDQARITFAEPLGNDAQIELRDAQGRLLRSMNGNGSRQVIIERDGLGAGLYVVRVMHGGAHLGAVRLVAE